VATLSWLHLTVEFDTQVTNDLLAQGSSATERLMKIAQRVGCQCTPRTDSYFPDGHTFVEYPSRDRERCHHRDRWRSESLPCARRHESD